MFVDFFFFDPHPGDARSAFRISAPGIIDTDTLDLKEFAGDANYRQPLE